MQKKKKIAIDSYVILIFSILEQLIWFPLFFLY